MPFPAGTKGIKTQIVRKVAENEDSGSSHFQSEFAEVLKISIFTGVP